MSTDLYLPDSNEFHPLEDFPGPAAILRAMHDTVVDKVFLRDVQRASTFRWWSCYQYISAGADIVACARALKRLLADHGLRPNATIVDLEEGNRGPADQHAWLAEMADDPADDLTYSGDYYARAHQLDTGQKFWIAAYQAREPTTAHLLWQFSDRYQFPGISAPCDASVFHGTVDDLLALTGGHPVVPQPQEEPVKATYARRSSSKAVCAAFDSGHTVTVDAKAGLGFKALEDHFKATLGVVFVDFPVGQYPAGYANIEQVDDGTKTVRNVHVFADPAADLLGLPK